MTPVDVLLALVLFQLKHYLTDFHWQTIWIVQTKGRYGHPGGLIHAGLHGLLSLPVLLLVAPFAPVLFTVILIFEMVLHYHIDWIKARGLYPNAELTSVTSAYWHYLGLDRAAHQLTYVAMLAALII